MSPRKKENLIFKQLLAFFKVFGLNGQAKMLVMLIMKSPYVQSRCNSIIYDFKTDWALLHRDQSILIKIAWAR